MQLYMIRRSSAWADTAELEKTAAVSGKIGDEEMSDKVQFIFITHNKITMEQADQLMGVTMHEPGVSRLVTVDVEEAAELAAS